MADTFNDFMRVILIKEGRGKLTNDPADRGGVTIWGITEARARAAGFLGPMAAMTEDQALAIYRLFYWEQPAFDKVASIMPVLGKWLLDIGINCGPLTVGKHLQRALNVLNLQDTLYKDLTVDGHCGAMTRAALDIFRARRGSEDASAVLMAMMQAQAVMRYVEIAEGDKSQERFLYGWLRGRALA